MKPHVQTWLTIIGIFFQINSFGQGPPILTDKPIMLGKNHGTGRIMYQNQSSDRISGHFIMSMADYNINTRFAVEGGLMLSNYLNDDNKNFKLSDLMIGAKYQYFKTDRKGFTYRVSARGAHAIRTLKSHSNIKPTGQMPWGTYGGLLAGIETLKFGFITELGIDRVAELTPGIPGYFFHGKASLGIPVLPHVFPVRQLNLFAEIENADQINAKSYVLYISPGIQYVYRVMAIEIAWQKAILDGGNISFYPDRTFVAGIRYIY